MFVAFPSLSQPLEETPEECGPHHQCKHENMHIQNASRPWSAVGTSLGSVKLHCVSSSSTVFAVPGIGPRPITTKTRAMLFAKTAISFPLSTSMLWRLLLVLCLAHNVFSLHAWRHQCHVEATSIALLPRVLSLYHSNSTWSELESASPVCSALHLVSTTTFLPHASPFQLLGELQAAWLSCCR